MVSKRLKEFDEVLQCEEIDLKTLRSLCFHGNYHYKRGVDIVIIICICNILLYTLYFLGIPDEGNYRSICWRLLLGLLVPKKSEWDSILRKKRELYQQFIGQFITHFQNKQIFLLIYFCFFV